ncbi:MAG: type I methionyl aminopeptidase [Patescibacteria group bacterium]|nr:type I methionyl aminopeptidase [Patescibacteria group bacterium]
MARIRIKTKDDIKILREGGKRHAEIMRLLVKKVTPGITTKEIDDYASELIKQGLPAQAGNDTASFLNYKPFGAKYPYPASVCISINDEIVHGIPNSKRVIKEGDIVSIDLGLTHKGLITDMAVTVAVGMITEDTKKLIEVTEKALQVGIKNAKGGKRTGDVGSSIERFVKQFGYGIVEELSGHGVGYEVHEDPFVPNFGEVGKGDVLQPDMVIAIEPMLNLGTKKIVLDKDGYTYRTKDGKVSAHFEHTILITKGEAEVLTK